MFKVGDKVVLIHNCCMNAPIGSTAIVTALESYCLVVKWIKTTGLNQMDGGYGRENFKLLVSDVGKQLLFSFMERQY